MTYLLDRSLLDDYLELEGEPDWHNRYNDRLSKEKLNFSGELNRGTCRSRQKTRVTDGHYGIELEGFMKNRSDVKPIQNRLVSLLKKSKTFIRIACKLDTRYLSNSESKAAVFLKADFNPDGDGILREIPKDMKGESRKTVIGRRFINILKSSFNGSLFMPASVLINSDLCHVVTGAGTSDPLECLTDVIFIQVPNEANAKGISQLLENIVHESIHAFNRVMDDKKTAPSKTPSRADKILNAIQEEGNTRKMVKKILGEISATTRNNRMLQELRNRSEQIVTSLPKVERDFFPGKLKMTYLEHFVFSELAKQQIDKAGLKPKRIQEINKEVARLEFLVPLNQFLVEKFPSTLTQNPKTKLRPVFVDPYFELRLISLVIHKRWKRFERLKQSGLLLTSRDKECILQQHQRSFFPGEPEPIRYSRISIKVPQSCKL